MGHGYFCPKVGMGLSQPKQVGHPTLNYLSPAANFTVKGDISVTPIYRFLPTIVGTSHPANSKSNYVNFALYYVVFVHDKAHIT